MVNYPEAILDLLSDESKKEMRLAGYTHLGDRSQKLV